MTTLFLKPQPVSCAPGSNSVCEMLKRFCPEYSQIPDTFKKEDNKWRRWAEEWFFAGLFQYPTPKEGIEVGEAMNHLKFILTCHELQHDHKMSATAYLASLWFLCDNSWN